MIPKECKRLAEVDFPIAVVSKHSAREKSIRHGHPSTLHLWWARRPLAACRAMLMALLLPDPCDPHCPEDFKTSARKILAPLPQPLEPDDDGLRRSLLRFIGDFANWDLAADPTYLSAARGLVKAAHPEETPLVVDPFAGGGSIPLEALRIGCEAFASDLNPVACLILKVMLEDIPRHGPELAEELRRVGKEIKEKAEKELAEFYPPDPDGSKPIAYLWARTVKCESPNCGAEIPLMRSFWLCKKANRKRALRYKVVRPEGKPPRVEFEIFEPKSDKEVPSGTVTRAKATCPCCGAVLPPDRVRAQLAEQHGGADVVFDEKGNRIGGARMTAVVTLHPEMKGRRYRLPTERDYKAVWKAQKCLKAILDEWERGGNKGLCPVPDEPTPPRNGHRATTAPRIYGMTNWRHLFSARQLLSLSTYASIMASQSAKHVGEIIADLVAIGLSKLAERLNVVCDWMVGVECSGHLYSHHDIPAGWAYSEAVPIASSSGSMDSALNVINGCLNAIGSNWSIGQVSRSDARKSLLPDSSAAVWFTDPPYYDAVAYADLSDLFYIWLKRARPAHRLLQDERGHYEGLTPKSPELTVTTAVDEISTPKKAVDFENGMREAFIEGRRLIHDHAIGSVVFAHKTTEGWEALLSSLVNGGWTITASWPIVTERGSRQNARNTASLAASVHLVCRPRPDDAPVGDWADVLRELPNRVGDWMERLQGEGIRGADLVFACIGPALEIFSRYSKVETAEGHEVKLAEYLKKVWEVVGRLALEQVLGTADLPAATVAAQAGAKARNGATGALEEDARLTALFLWTLQSTNGEAHRREAENIEENDIEDEKVSAPFVSPRFSLPYDVVRRFAQPLGIAPPKWEGRIIETKKGLVRLLPVSERAKQLFGKDGLESDIEELLSFSLKGPRMLPGFEYMAAKPQRMHRGRKRKIRVEDPSKVDATATTLDRVHAAMLLQASGQANALRALIKAEQNRGPEFLRLANALSALYPKGSEEKRLIDAMLLAVPK